MALATPSVSGILKVMKIAVLGTGYVGLTTATLLACCGHEVIAIEPNIERRTIIKTGRSFFFETGLDPLVAHVVNNGLLTVTDNYDAISSAGVVFSCVGTPDNADGSPNLEYVYSAAESSAQKLKNGAIFVQKSTVPVGTGTQTQNLFQKLGKSLAYVSNPEFLREGTALLDTLWFDRVVVGSSYTAAAGKVLGFYRELARNRADIAKLAALTAPAHYTEGGYIATSQNSAELIKVTANAFLALKISFANSIAKLADKTNADVVEVMDAVGADKRIGRAFLNAGRGYGGGCFPKDVSGLISSAQNFGVDMGIMHEAAELNASMPGYIVNKMAHYLPNGLNSRIAILGLAFKAGTSDARKSPAIAIANICAERGAAITAYDPAAIEEARHDLHTGITVSDSIESCLKGADAVLVATDWPEFTSLDASYISRTMSGTLFVDAVNAFHPALIHAADLVYIGVGR
jgi:UDPglucose 6-dehydrogenase